MNQNLAIELYAGGPGSGCQGPNCGRPAGHEGSHVSPEGWKDHLKWEKRQEKTDKAEKRRDAFIKDLNLKEEQVTSNSIWQHVETSKGKAGLTLKFNYGDPKAEVEIHWLTAQARGAGRAAMEHVVKMADKHQIPLKLWALPLPGQGENTGFKLSRSKLEKFYRGFGFKATKRDDGIALMKREPKK